MADRMNITNLTTKYGGNVSEVARELGLSREMRLYTIEN